LGSQSNHRSTFFVIPSFNEGAVIRSTVQPLLDAGYSVVVVDDGSTDGTQKALAGSGAHYLRHPLNVGQGAALQTGVDYALAQGADYIVHFDADGQHRLEDAERLLAAVMADEIDVALGSRFLRKEDWAAVPLGRRLLLKGGVIVNGLLTGMWLSDAHNGARAMNRAAAQRIRLRENGFAHATEILQEIRDKGLRFAELPIRIHYTDYSQFKGQKASSALRILMDLVIRRLFR
jgi:glycosyltransferase involved in cell wall biosynthesis